MLCDNVCGRFTFITYSKLINESSCPITCAWWHDIFTRIRGTDIWRNRGCRWRTPYHLVLKLVVWESLSQGLESFRHLSNKPAGHTPFATRIARPRSICPTDENMGVRQHAWIQEKGYGAPIPRKNHLVNSPSKFIENRSFTFSGKQRAKKKNSGNGKFLTL